jgi:hypothetical protein
LRIQFVLNALPIIAEIHGGRDQIARGSPPNQTGVVSVLPVAENGRTFILHV